MQIIKSECFIELSIHHAHFGAKDQIHQSIARHKMHHCIWNSI